MARVYILVLVLGLGVLYKTCAIDIVGKGYFCRDPDTGKLHGVNTTWNSTSFCGHYTCKLRKTGPQTQDPLRKFKVANINISSLKPAKKYIGHIDYLLTAKENIIVTNITGQSTDKGNVTNTTDRYLNENEIKTITNLLYNIKKSDLDAIIDIYNIAQEVYKDAKPDTGHHIENTELKADINADTLANTLAKPKQNTKYWYEPLRQQSLLDNTDMKEEGSSLVTTEISVIPLHETDQTSYFSGALEGKDFRKLPYQYPMSNFQRFSSYLHPAYSVSQSLCQNYPCNHRYYSYYPGTNVPLNNPMLPPESKPVVQPYPYHQYNITATSQHSFSNPWTPFNHYRVNKDNLLDNNKKTNYLTSSPLEITVTQAPVNKNPAIKVVKAEPIVKKINEEGSLLKSLVAGLEKHKKPTWWTASLSNDILNDVRAHLDEKHKRISAFPFKNKIILEKIGKVNKVDEYKNRFKRSIQNKEEVKENEIELNNKVEVYEVYLKKTICEPDINPGFFRVGNLSRPFPACCPERIEP